MLRNKTVISGMGCVLPIGKNLDACSDVMARVMAGDELGRSISQSLGAQPVGRIPDAFFNEVLGEREKTKYDRISQLVACVIGHCIASAGLAGNEAELEKTGVISGSGFGCLGATNDFFRTLWLEGPALVDPMKFPLTSHNYPVSISAIRYGLKGPITSIVASIGSSMDALLFANRLILGGQAKRIIVIGVDEITDLVCTLLGRLGYLSNTQVPGGGVSGQRSSRGPAVPFEGCSGVILEECASAMERGAPIYGEVAGWDSRYGSQQTIQHDRILGAMKRALKRAGGKEQSVDVLVANRSGIETDDAAENRAVAAAVDEGYSFGSQWELKPYIGNYLGASGITELVLALETIKTGKSMRGANGDLSPASKQGRNGIRSMLLNNFGSGGNITSLLVNTDTREAAHV